MEEIMTLLKIYDKLYYEWSKNSGMSETAFYILMTVWEKDGNCTQADICEYWSYSRQTVNSAIKLLEDDGYLKLVQQKSGRKKTIALTESGRQYAARYIAPLIKLDEDVWEGIPKEERDVCIGVINKHLQTFSNRLKGLLEAASESK